MTIKAYRECDWCKFKTAAVGETVKNDYGRNIRGRYDFPDDGWQDTNYWGLKD